MLEVTKLINVANSLFALDLHLVVYAFIGMLALTVFLAVRLVKAQAEIFRLKVEIRKLRNAGRFTRIKAGCARLLRSLLGRLEAEPQPKAKRAHRATKVIDEPESEIPGFEGWFR